MVIIKQENKSVVSSSGLFKFLALIFATLFCTPALSQEIFPPSAYQGYSPNVENGAYMASAAGCASCHANENSSDILSGGIRMDNAMGVLFTPNISANTSVGIGNWTNSEFLNAVMRGISPEGKHYYPAFPYSSYAGLNPEDVLDIKAYLLTLPSSDNSPPDHQIGFPYFLQETLAVWKMANFNTQPFVPTEDTQMERGRYLVEAAGHCNECHTPRNFSLGYDVQRKFMGEKGLTGAFAPNISSAVVSAVGAEMFVENVLGQGMKLSGSPITDPTKRHLVSNWGKLSVEDRRAIYAYLTGEEVLPPPPPDITVAQCGVDTVPSSSSSSTSASGGDAGLARAADDFMGKYCRSCHGPGERNSGIYAAGDINSIARDPAFVTPGNPGTSRLLASISSGSMPIGAQPNGGEVEALTQWIASLATSTSQAPSGPANHVRNRPMIMRGEMVQAALADIGNVDGDDRQYMRYFEFRAQANAVFPCETQEQSSERMAFYRAGFLKLINSVSWGPRLVNPDFVEGSQDLLMRIDMRDLAWTPAKYDALIADYPYGIDPQSDPQLLVLALETGTQLPIMRADWF